MVAELETIIKQEQVDCPSDYTLVSVHLMQQKGLAFLSTVSVSWQTLNADALPVFLSHRYHLPLSMLRLISSSRVAFANEQRSTSASQERTS